MFLLIQLACLLCLALGILRPQFRGAAAQVLASSALAAGLLAALVGDQERTLELTHSFVAYVGNEIKDKQFPVETVVAPAAAMPMLWIGYALPWALWLWRRRPRPGTGSAPCHPFWLPLILAVSGCALALAWEKAAAPAELIRPFPFDRFLIPATFVGSLLLAQSCRSLLLTLCWLILLVTMCRLPLALFSTLASQRSWGTSLDIHSIVVFANPLVQQPLEVTAGSAQQFGWLIWGPQLFVLPSLYMLSFGGIAFAAVMFATHPKQEANYPSTR